MKKKPTTVYFPPEVKEFLQEAAAKEYITQTAYITNLIAREMKKRK